MKALTLIMQTPNNPAGQMTEQVMAKVRAANPDISTAEYNQRWADVYRTFEAKLSLAEVFIPDLPPRLVKTNAAGVIIDVPSQVEGLSGIAHFYRPAK